MAKDSVKGGIQELIQVVRAGNIIAEDNYLDRAVPDRALFNMSNVLVDINTGIQQMASAMVADHMKALETVREQSKYNEDILKALQGLKPDKTKKDKKDGDFSWLGLAAALVAGLVLGGIAFIASYVKGMLIVWKGLASALKLDVAFAKFFSVIKSGFTFIEGIMTGGFAKLKALFGDAKLFKMAEQAWTAVKTFFSESGLVKAISGFFGKVMTGVKSVFQWEGLVADFKALWVSIKEMFGWITKPLSGLFSAGEGSAIMKYITPLLDFFAPLKNFFKGLGSILGKLAVPLTVIMGIWDSVSGALDGWNNTEGSFMDKLVGALKGGLTGLLNGLVGGLLDLLKDGLSWVLEFFGMKDAAAWLDSFSFSAIIEQGIGNAVDAIIGLFKDMVMGPIEVVKGLWAAMNGKMDWADFFKMFLAKAISFVVAPFNAVASVFGYDLKKKALALMGLSDPGEGSSAATPTPMNSQTPAAALPGATAENSAAKGETMMAQAGAAVSQGVAVVNNAGKTIVNNATTAIVSAKTTASDALDRWARGGYSMPWN